MQSWNPAANGRVIRHDDGRCYEIAPDGWKRRKDVERQIKIQDKIDEKRQEKLNGKRFLHKEPAGAKAPAADNSGAANAS